MPRRLRHGSLSCRRRGHGNRELTASMCTEGCGWGVGMGKSNAQHCPASSSRLSRPGNENPCFLVSRVPKQCLSGFGIAQHGMGRLTYRGLLQGRMTYSDGAPEGQCKTPRHFNPSARLLGDQKGQQLDTKAILSTANTEGTRLTD